MSTENLFIMIQWIAIGLSFFLFIYAKMQKPSQMQKWVTILNVATMLMLFGYTLEMKSENLQAAYYGTIISYVGQPYVMVSVFLLILTFYEFKISNRLVLTCFLVGAIIPVLVYTNEYHHAYYTSVGFDANAPFSPLILEHGPLYYVNTAVSLTLVAATAIMTVLGFHNSKSPVKRRLSVYSLLMILSGVAGFAGYALGLTGGYDSTMLGLFLENIFMAILFFNCRIFDVVDRAKDYALEASDEGLAVYDDAGKVVYQNPTAQKLVGQAIPETYLESIPEGDSIYQNGEQAYSVTMGKIMNEKDYLGKSIEVRDISEAFNYGKRLEEAVAATRAKLEGIQRTILGSFASLVEARSLETGDHIRRVSRYTDMIAKALKKQGKFADILNDDYIRILVDSAPLHDVGKISVRDTILLKPGKLTPEEFEEMKKHAELGAKVIKNTMAGLESQEYVDMATEIAKHHHERWDGTGYPDGLKGEQIPLSARIVAVADCYDAMTSKRCYKEAFPDKKALGILKEEAGSHFDPQVVEAFISNKE